MFDTIFLVESSIFDCFWVRNMKELVSCSQAENTLCTLHHQYLRKLQCTAITECIVLHHSRRQNEPHYVECIAPPQWGTSICTVYTMVQFLGRVIIIVRICTRMSTEKPVSRLWYLNSWKTRARHVTLCKGCNKINKLKNFENCRCICQLTGVREYFRYFCMKAKHKKCNENIK